MTESANSSALRYAVQVRQNKQWYFIPAPGNPNTLDFLKARTWDTAAQAKDVAFTFETGKVVEIHTTLKETNEQPRRLRRYRW